MITKADYKEKCIAAARELYRRKGLKDKGAYINMETGEVSFYGTLPPAECLKRRVAYMLHGDIIKNHFGDSTNRGYIIKAHKPLIDLYAPILSVPYEQAVEYFEMITKVDKPFFFVGADNTILYNREDVMPHITRKLADWVLDIPVFEFKYSECTFSIDEREFVADIKDGLVGVEVYRQTSPKEFSLVDKRGADNAEEYIEDNAEYVYERTAKFLLNKIIFQG